MYTNYTYCIVDLGETVPTREVEIVQDHPGKQIAERSVEAQTWFDQLKLSQTKYLQNDKKA